MGCCLIANASIKAATLKTSIAPLKAFFYAKIAVHEKATTLKTSIALLKAFFYAKIAVQ
jgi:hypothetical protein